MVGSIDQWGLRFHRAMLGFCAVLFGYMVGLLTRTVQLGTDYSPLQWTVVGFLVIGSAALLTFQVGQVRRRKGGRDRGVGRDRRLNVADDGMAMPPGDGDAQSEDELRDELLRVEEEHAALLSSTIGMVSVGNGELAERANELERKADDVRARLGEPTRHPPEPPRHRMILGWVTLCASVVAILTLVLFLPH